MRVAMWLLIMFAARLAVAAEAGDVRALPDAYKTLVNPKCSHCRIEATRRASDLRDDDRVLCWIRGYSDGGAIPIRFFLNPYRVISDSYGVFVYDPDAGYARGFAPSYDFTFYGWRHGVMVMKHKDGTLYSCLSGLVLDGPKKGTRLQALPTLMSDWGDWLKRYPGNVAYEMFDKYQPEALPTGADKNSIESRGPSDKRLGAETAVFGVFDGGKARAYLLDTLSRQGLIQETIDGRPRVALWYGPTKSAAAYRPIASPPGKDSKEKPRAVMLTKDDSHSSSPFVDSETGSHWDIAGRAVDGKLKDWTLEWLDGTLVKWFAWASEYPQSTLYESHE